MVGTCQIALRLKSGKHALHMSHLVIEGRRAVLSGATRFHANRRTTMDTSAQGRAFVRLHKGKG